MPSDSESDAMPILRLGSCEVCNAQPAKYSCPKCELKTCSLPCVNIHKRELKCDGIRDKTKFVRMENFTERELFSDYRMLEETARMIYGKKRDEGKKLTRIDRDLPFMLHLLNKAASRRGTALSFTMHHFTRRRQNTTFYDRKLDKIKWRIEWIFPNADPQSVKFVDSQCLEDTKLADLLDKYLDPEMEKFDGSSSLVYYQAAGHIGVKVLLKAERVKGSSRKFYELDMDLSLRENLCGKCLVEFPVLFVVFRDHSYGLEIIDSDDETNVQSEFVRQNSKDTSHTRETTDDRSSKPPGRQLLTERVAMERKRAIEKEMAADAKRKPRNLLIATGYSSEDLSFSSGDESTVNKARLRRDTNSIKAGKI